MSAIDCGVKMSASVSKSIISNGNSTMRVAPDSGKRHPSPNF